MIQPYKPLYTVNEAAKILMVNKDFVNREINKGRIPALNLGRRKIRGSDLEKYIENYPADNLVIEKGEMK
ncbi:helix-turn-helix domain-containing protein [Lacrimispora sp.]|uniref:helix-turn-helix domain-containing protein n=1 Tax=Lacrimispora sp. TaxID=2719234 RepID=UPI00289B753B|nr:helix-turn-helix domain-containing protein [Lacrimispora sp.]